MARAETHLVQSPATWELLVSPVRAEIVEALRLIGPCSIAEIGAVIDRPADSLYAHIEKLQKAGMVVDAGYRKGDRNIEQLVDLIADDFVVDFKDGTGAAENKAIVSTVNSFLKAAARAVRDSAAARQLEFAPETRNISINYELSWLTPEAFQEVRGLIKRLKRIMDDGKLRREGRLYLTLALATPVTRKRGAGGRAATPKRSSAARARKKAGAGDGAKPSKDTRTTRGGKRSAERRGKADPPADAV